LTEASQSGGSLYAYKLPEIKRKRRIRSPPFLPDKRATASVSAADSEGVNIANDLTGNSDSKRESVVQDRSTSSTPSSGVEHNQLLPSGFQKVEAQMKIDISEWQRTTLHKGFKVRGWGGIFSPGAPGFPYVFRIPGMSQVFYYIQYKDLAF
jgi:hypothetical protein